MVVIVMVVVIMSVHGTEHTRHGGDVEAVSCKCEGVTGGREAAWNDGL
jgi:hypothetical protein